MNKTSIFLRATDNFKVENMEIEKGEEIRASKMTRPSMSGPGGKQTDFWIEIPSAIVVDGVSAVGTTKEISVTEFVENGKLIEI